MCGIFGTFDRDEFRHLLYLNKERGAAAVGICRIAKDPNVVHVEKHFLSEFDEDDWFDRDTTLHKWFKNYDTYYLGHVQAPTEGQEIDLKEVHPFELSHLVWAHNGIIQNHIRLRDNFMIGDTPKTDSYVIGGLLLNLCLDWSVLQELDGTFSCWVVDTTTKDIFIFRATNSLYKNESTFSSVSFESSKEVPQGRVYKLKDKNFEEIATFNIKTQPFYIPAGD